MELLDRITIDPDICHGRPTLRGLRYTVELVLELLSSGMTPEEILADYEDLRERGHLRRVGLRSTADPRKAHRAGCGVKFLVDAHLPRRRPFKLLFVTTGNIRNSTLEHLFLANLARLVDAVATWDYVELSRSAIVLHS